MAVPPRTIVDYYKSVEKTMGGPAQTQNFARLFTAAGSGMCPGFGNAEDFNTLKAIEQWVEKGIAPDKIILTHRDDQRRAFRTRPVCAYPKTARYKGSGDPNDAADFSCIDPGK